MPYWSGSHLFGLRYLMNRRGTMSRTGRTGITAAAATGIMTMTQNLMTQNLMTQNLMTQNRSVIRPASHCCLDRCSALNIHSSSPPSAH